MDSPASGPEKCLVALANGSPTAHPLEEEAGGPYQLLQNRGQQEGVASPGLLQTAPVGDPSQLCHVLKVGFLLPQEICSRREPPMPWWLPRAPPSTARHLAYPAPAPCQAMQLLSCQSPAKLWAVCDLGHKRATAERMGRPAASVLLAQMPQKVLAQDEHRIQTLLV